MKIRKETVFEFKGLTVTFRRKNNISNRKGPIFYYSHITLQNNC